MMKTQYISNEPSRKSIFYKENLFKLDDYQVKQLVRYKQLSIQSKTIQHHFDCKDQSKQSKCKESQILKQSINSKQSKQSRQRKKIKKDVLNNCFIAVTECYQAIIGTLSSVFAQLVKLNLNPSNAKYSKIIYTQTVQRGLANIKNIGHSPKDTNSNYQNLLKASQQLSNYMSNFKKQLKLQQKIIDLPTQQTLFKSIYDGYK